MEYKLGNSKRIFEHGTTYPIVCPKCNNKVEFAVFTNFDTRLAVKLPPIEAKNIYFLVCPSCASTFGVDSKKGKSFDKNSKLAIGNYDLKELEKFDL